MFCSPKFVYRYMHDFENHIKLYMSDTECHSHKLDCNQSSRASLKAACTCTTFYYMYLSSTDFIRGKVSRIMYLKAYIIGLTPKLRIHNLHSNLL